MTRTIRKGLSGIVTGAMALVLASTPDLVSQQATQRAEQETEKSASQRPSLESRAAMKKVGAILATAKGKKGEPRHAIMRTAADGYAKVMADFAAEPVAAASASYAAAEIWRKLGELAKAKPLYEKSIEADRIRFEERSLLQLAHIARRSKDSAGSIALYQKVATLKPKSGRAHEARLWIGKSHATAGRKDEAITAFQAAVDQAATPRQVIDACNRLASLLVKMGKLDAADGVIARAAEASKADPGGKGPAAERAKKSLAKAYAQMSARRALQRAKDRANGAHKDAQDIEKRGVKK